MTNNKMESGFRINNLILLESKFKRINNVQFEDANLDLNIDTEVSVNNNIISVAETVSVKKTHNNTEQFSFLVKMVGIFECIGESQLKDYEKFGKINGAAIIFPYIREHITNLSMKAGLGPIILPPVNFTKN
ncbi:MAG: protein-export chaperone SecB [Bacteroidota bacterium]|jgi:preprotein translocase subunit SecB|nr:protein-export chaperone SecB [Bacteroidales bacterium]MDI9535106.1 protein-export chaperone SecB [Bacteroidota bacterium]OQC46300.1 MAG: preprotein translocase subunit SecB [Bacteroidetes bacterium ADurb.Bin028]MCK9256289.1 protein-export chaperone SecB [Bacteroidales bacterium]MCK9499333.1 protein-export chaperone SecB [Bacteroidales bacterium]